MSLNALFAQIGSVLPLPSHIVLNALIQSAQTVFKNLCKIIQIKSFVQKIFKQIKSHK